MPQPIELPSIHKETIMAGQVRSRSSLVQFWSKRSPINAPIITLLKKDTVFSGKETFNPQALTKDIARSGPSIFGAGNLNFAKSRAPIPAIIKRRINPPTLEVNILNASQPIF